MIIILWSFASSKNMNSTARDSLTRKVMLATAYYQKYDNRRRINCILETSFPAMNQGMSQLTRATKSFQTISKCTSWINSLPQQSRSTSPDDQLFYLNWLWSNPFLLTPEHIILTHSAILFIWFCFSCWRCLGLKHISSLPCASPREASKSSTLGFLLLRQVFRNPKLSLLTSG